VVSNNVVARNQPIVCLFGLNLRVAREVCLRFFLAGDLRRVVDLLAFFLVTFSM
jgi:hypothetical protein